jgi:acetyl-CoA synthetase
MLGRDDDIIISSGHNISNVEVERVLAEHAACSEAAVVGIPDPICGQRIVAFIVLPSDIVWTDDLFADFSQHVSRRMSPTVKPKEYFIVLEIPKTRSGKVMRRLFRNLLIGEPVGDTSSLVNDEVVEDIKRAIERMRRSESI